MRSTQSLKYPVSPQVVLHSEMELRKIEECKMDCARKFFSKITSDQVKYDIVNSYAKFIELVKQERRMHTLEPLRWLDRIRDAWNKGLGFIRWLYSPNRDSKVGGSLDQSNLYTIPPRNLGTTVPPSLIIEGDEQLSRCIVFSKHMRAAKPDGSPVGRVKPGAFIPHPYDDLSVNNLWATAKSSVF